MITRLHIVAAGAVLCLATSTSGVAHADERADGTRFRGGVAFTAGTELVPDVDFSAGYEAF